MSFLEFLVVENLNGTRSDVINRTNDFHFAFIDSRANRLASSGDFVDSSKDPPTLRPTEREAV